MGYTHYWYRETEIASETYECIVSDFKKALPLFKVLDVKLAGPLGKGEPIISKDNVAFNGSEACGHPRNGHIGIAWPASSVKGGAAPSSDQAIVGSWFAGALLEQRACDGDCSHESFVFPRVREPQKWEPIKENGLWFDFTKTAFKPYDVAVTVFLVIAKHYLGRRIRVRSDGELAQWMDAMKICQNGLGYGMDFALDRDD